MERGKKQEQGASWARAVVLVVGACAAICANAQSTSVPPSPAPLSLPELRAQAVVSPDLDWQARWDSSSPKFNAIERVARGRPITILTFASGAVPDASGVARLLCDLTLTRPDGTLAVSERAQPCLARKGAGAPEAIYLTTLAIAFKGEATDALGMWRFSMALRDPATGRSARVAREFELVDFTP